MTKTVLVTGATGFTGGYVVEALCRKEYEVSCFVRPGSDTAKLKKLPVMLHQGDLNDSTSLQKALQGQGIFVNVASIGFGHGPSIVAACEQAGVGRAVFFSTTAVFTTLRAGSKAKRVEAEQSIKASKLRFTILRPTMIYGSVRDRNMIKLIRFIDKFPGVPVFGNGQSLQQPVFVQDLARAVVQVLDTENTVGKTYNLSGLQPITYDEVIDTVARLLHKRVAKVHLPVGLSLLAVKLASQIPGLPKFSVEQVLRLNENKAFPHQAAQDDFDYSPLPFEKGIAKEIAEYRSSGGV